MVVELLADAGIEAKHWSLLGAHNAPDSEIMIYASANDFVVFTHDLDFGAILAAIRGKKPSVVQIRTGDVRPHIIGKQIISVLRQMATELEDGALRVCDCCHCGLGASRMSVLNPRSRTSCSIVCA